jgi:hypothetical protein
MRRAADPGRLPGMEGAQLLGGRYVLLDQIGVGGMAVVWRARDEVLGRPVAVKLLAGKHAGEPDARDRIRAEARAAAALSHPNIAQVYDYGEARELGASIPYVVMELVRGGTLQERMDAGPMSPRFAMRMAAEVAAALAAAHADGLVHRDIKPANVMVTETGAKVVDFGIAAAINPAGTGDDDFEVLGTPAYLAPERLTGDGVEPASDVYALGVLLYRMLSGHSPWSADTTTQMLTAHVYVDPEPLTPLPGVPEYVTELCNRCLSKDTTERPSAREVAALLAQGAGLRVVEDALPAGPAGAGHDNEPSVLIRPRSAVRAPVWYAETAIGEPGPVADPTPSRDPAAVVPGAALAGGFVAGSGSATPGPDAPASGGPAAVNPGAISGPGDPAATVLGAAPSGPAAPAASDPAVSAAGSGATAARRRRRRLPAVVAAGAVLAIAGLLWWVVDPDDDATQQAAAVPVVSGAPASAAPSAGAPVVAGKRSAPPGAQTPGAGVPMVPAVPTVNGEPGTTPGAPGLPPPADGAPATTTPAAEPEEPGPTTTAPTTDPPAQERTFSSAGGSVRATCPGASTAQLLSWSAIKPYKVNDVDDGPGSSAVAVFKRGNDLIRMTVTCSGGVPSNSTDDG